MAADGNQARAQPHRHEPHHRLSAIHVGFTPLSLCFAAKGWRDADTAFAELQAAACRSKRHREGASKRWLRGRHEMLQHFSHSPLPCYDLGCRHFVRLRRGYTLLPCECSWHHKMIRKQHEKENKIPSSIKFSTFPMKGLIWSKTSIFPNLFSLDVL